MRLSGKELDQVDMMFKLMEYEHLSDWEDNFVCSIDTQYTAKGDLSRAQFEKLQEVFKRAADRA